MLDFHTFITTIGSVDSGDSSGSTPPAPSTVVRSLDCPGTGTKYLRYSNTPGPQLGSGDFSIAFFMRPTFLANLGETREVFGSGQFDLDNEASSYFRFYVNSTGFNRISFSVSDGTTYYTVQSGLSSLTDNTWAFVSVTYNATTDVLSLSINRAAATTATSVASPVDEEQDFRISAAALTVGNSPFQGQLSSIGIWQRVLTGTELDELYNSGDGKLYASLQAGTKVGAANYWQLDELAALDEGVTRSDSVGDIDMEDFGSLASSSEVPTEAVFDVLVRAVEEKGKLIFPQDFCRTHENPEDKDKKALDEVEAELGPYLYSGNYYNNPVADDLIEFKEDWFHTYNFEETKDKLRTAKCIISVDPATKNKETNDPTGIIVAKITEDGCVYIVDARDRRLLPNELITEIFSLVDIYGPDVVTFEVVSAEILWEDLFQQEMKIRNKHFRFEKHEPGTKDTKPAKIRKLIPYYARGQVYHKQGLTELERQLREFPRNAHDDLIDSLQAQIPYWKGKVVVQHKKLEKYSVMWWDELRRRNKGSSGTAEEKLFDEFKKKDRGMTSRKPNWQIMEDINNNDVENLNNDELWINRIARREQALKQKASENHWERYIREYLGDFSELLQGTERVIPLNLIYAYVRTEVPDLYLQDPYFEFTPKQSTTIGVAKLKEVAVNDLWHRKKLKREIKKAIQDAKLISHAWLKVGYNANLGNLEESENNTENSNNEDYFLYRINWRHVLFNDEAVDVPYDCTWIAHKFYIPLKTAKDNKDFNSKKEQLVGVRLAGNDKKENQQFMSPTAEGDVLYAELYEIWDKVNQKVLIVSSMKGIGVLQERPWPYTTMQGFPFLFLNLSMLNDDAYGISDVGMGEKHVLEKTKIRSAFLEHLKRGNRQLMTKPGNFSDEAKDAYAKGDDSALLEVENPEAVKPLPYAAFQTDVFGLESRLDDDLSQIWGQRATDRAGKAATQTRTKFELQAQGSGTTNRLAEERNIIEDMTEEAAEKISCLLEQFATTPYYVQLTGKRPEEVAAMLATRPSATQPGAVSTPYGFTITNEDIKGPVDVRVKESSAIPLDKQGKIDLLKEMIQMYVNLAGQPKGPFLKAVSKMLVEESGLHELTDALDAEGQFQAQQAQQAQQQAEQQQAVQAGAQATEMQLKAQELSTKQQKVESDAQIGLLEVIRDIQLKLADLNQKMSTSKGTDE